MTIDVDGPLSNKNKETKHFTPHRPMIGAHVGQYKQLMIVMIYMDTTHAGLSLTLSSHSRASLNKRERKIRHVHMMTVRHLKPLARSVVEWFQLKLAGLVLPT